MGEKFIILCSKAMLRYVFMQRVRKSLFLSTVPGPSILKQVVLNFPIPCW